MASGGSRTCQGGLDVEASGLQSWLQEPQTLSDSACSACLRAHRRCVTRRGTPSAHSTVCTGRVQTVLLEPPAARLYAVQQCMTLPEAYLQRDLVRRPGVPRLHCIVGIAAWLRQQLRGCVGQAQRGPWHRSPHLRLPPKPHPADMIVYAQTVQLCTLQLTVYALQRARPLQGAPHLRCPCAPGAHRQTVVFVN